MMIELAIDHLEITSSSTFRAEDLAAAIELELDRLSTRYGLPFSGNAAAVEIDTASFLIDPGATVEELGSSIARQLMHGLHRESGSLPWGLERGDDAPNADSGRPGTGEVS